MLTLVGKHAPIPSLLQESNVMITIQQIWMDVHPNAELKLDGLVHLLLCLRVKAYVETEWSNLEKSVTMEDLLILQIVLLIVWDRLLVILVIMEPQQLLRFVMKFVEIEF